MLLIVGLDGATWDVLDPLIAAGCLPTLGGLRRAGAWGALASTVPAATLPSWTTFMTGVNPGKHGLFDFTRREPGTYAVRFVNATFRRAPSIWERLSRAGRRVCVLGLPGTYPPEPVNGCMVSGFDTPVTTRADASFVHPRELVPVVRAHGGFPFADFQELRVSPGWYARARARLLRGIAIKTRLACALARRERWDCFLVLFGESDTVAHHFWHLSDAASPRHDAGLARALGDVMRTVYEALDGAVARLLAAAPWTSVLVVSDHGSGGVGTTAVHLNRWLETAGFQRRARVGDAGRWKAVAARVVPARWQARVFRGGGGRWASRLETRSRFAGIVWEGTQAFSEEVGYFPSIWLNVRGREPRGTVAPEDYERVRDAVCAAARAWRDPVSGQPVVREIWRREELYSGPCTVWAPDLVLELGTPGGYAYACLPTARAPAGAPPVRVLGAEEIRGGKLAGLGGSHRPDGIVVLAGAAAPPAGCLEGVRMADMAPTVLAACGLPAPAEFDGVTITDSVRTEGSVGVSTSSPAAHAFSAADERELEERLRALGYRE